MEKNKLLISLMALVSVLCVEACSTSSVEGSTDGGDHPLTNSDDSGSSTSSSNTDLGSGNWKGGNPTDPSELVEKAYYMGNYSVQLQYKYYESDGTITENEYIEAMEAYYKGESDNDSLQKYYELEESVSLQEFMLFNIYYDVDYIYVEEYLQVGNDYNLIFVDVLVNTSDGLWEYASKDLYNWDIYTPDLYASYGVSCWEEYYGSLFDAYESGLLDHLDYYQAFGFYDFDDWQYNAYADAYLSAYSAEWFVALGGDWLFGSYAYTFAYYLYEYYYTSFNRTSQQLTSAYYYSYLDYVDGSDENLYIGEEDIYMIVHDVGTTDVSSTVYYYHDYFQSLMQ